MNTNRNPRGLLGAISDALPVNELAAAAMAAAAVVTTKSRRVSFAPRGVADSIIVLAFYRPTRPAAF